jgi:hypothetical protein
MAEADQCKYVAYRLSGAPIRAFGETYVIAAAMVESAGVYRCEYFVVTKRDSPHLYHETFTFEPNGVPEDVLKVDVDFLIGEARQQAENYLSQRLFDIAEEKGVSNLLDYRLDLIEMSYMPLHGSYMRGQFVEETRAVAERTACAQLKRHLNLVVRSSFTRRPG